MKTWNAPEVQELNINETADGFFNFDWESPLDILSKKVPDTPVTPEEESQ